MAWKRKTGVDTTTSLPTGLASWRKISSYIKQLIKASQFEYHESEAFEVKAVILNDPSKHGVVSGTFLNNPNQSIFDGIVYPINSNITNIPLIGEQVAVIEYNGKHFYTDIINRKNSPNENAIPGASGAYIPNTKYGDTFERKDVKKIHVNEGDIVYEGRFGTSIKLGSDGKNKATGGPKPQIKIVAGHRDIALHLATQNIDEDDSSIYLLGAVDKSEGKDKKILIKSNGIFITGRDEIRLNSNKINLNSDEIKIGNDADQSVVRGDDLKQFLDDLLSDLDLHFTSAMAAITPGGVIVTGGAAASPVFKVGIQAIKTKLATNKMLSDKVKTT